MLPGKLRKLRLSSATFCFGGDEVTQSRGTMLPLSASDWRKRSEPSSTRDNLNPRTCVRFPELVS